MAVQCGSLFFFAPMRVRILDMTKKRVVSVILILVFSLLVLSAGIIPFLQLSPYYLVDSTPLLYDKWPSGGDDGFRAMLNNKTIEGSSETIQDTILRFDRRPELLAAGFEIETESIFFAIKIDIREELSNFIGFKPSSNIPYLGNTKYVITNAQYPQVAFIEYSNPYFFVSVGRRKLDMGPGKYSFMLSEEAQPNLDAIALGASYIEGKFSLDYSFYAIGGSNSTINGNGNETEKIKTFFIHKVSASNDVFRFGLSEMNCVYGAYPGIFDMTPFVLWHNLYQEEHSNVMIEVSMEGKIGPLRFWAQYAQDDLYFKGEGGFNNKPTGIGIGTGFDWNIIEGERYSSLIRKNDEYALKEKNLKDEGGIHLIGEFYWATNYLYNRRENYGEGKFVNDKYGKLTFPYRFYSSYGGFTDKVDAYYLGFPYGPGSILFSLSLEMENKVMKGNVSASLLMRGEDNIDTVIDNSTQDTWLWLNGEVKRVWSVGCNLRLNLEKFVKGLEIDLDGAINYDEYYDAFVPVVAIGVVKVF